MTAAQRIEVPLSKTKIIFMLLGALAFVAIGFWFIIDSPEIQNSFWGHPIKLAILGYASVIFFGLCVVIFVRKLPDTRPGLVLDEKGLYDNSGALSAGYILWTDIENLSVLEIHKQKLIMIEVKNPQEYIDRQTSLFKRRGMELNYKMYGTPICITTNGLIASFDQILELLTQKFEEKRENA